jgi:hypothetical protein
MPNKYTTLCTKIESLIMSNRIINELDSVHILIPNSLKLSGDRFFGFKVTSADVDYVVISGQAFDAITLKWIGGECIEFNHRIAGLLSIQDLAYSRSHF